MVRDDDLGKFIELFFQKTGKRLTKDEALPKLLSLLEMVRIVYRPISQGEHYALLKRRKETGHP